MLADRGLERVYVGVESGSEEVPNLLRKPQTQAKVMQGVERVTAAGVGVGIILLAGVGGRTLADTHVEATADLVGSLPLASPGIRCRTSSIFDAAYSRRLLPVTAYRRQVRPHCVRACVPALPSPAFPFRRQTAERAPCGADTCGCLVFIAKIGHPAATHHLRELFGGDLGTAVCDGRLRSAGCDLRPLRGYRSVGFLGVTGVTRVGSRHLAARSERGAVVLVLVHVLHFVCLRRHDCGARAAGADDFDVFETLDALREATLDGLHRHRGDATARTGTADRDGRGSRLLVDVSNLEVAPVLLDLRDVVTQVATRLPFESFCTHCN
jgi:hypothetical protein